MKVSEALALIDTTLSRVNANREGHRLLIQAMDIIKVQMSMKEQNRTVAEIMKEDEELARCSEQKPTSVQTLNKVEIHKVPK